MAKWKYEVPTLEGMDEATAKEYIKVGDIYRLDVEGVEDVTGLKNTAEARKKERDALALELKESKDAQKALDDEKAEAERKRLEEKGEYKTLAEKAEADRLAASTELADLKSKIADGERIKLALESVVGMTADPVKAELLKEQALKFIESSSDGVAGISGPDGIKDVAGLKAHIEKTMPFLVDASPAGGGGGNGGSTGGTAKTLSQTTDAELIQLRETNKAEYDRIIKENK